MDALQRRLFKVFFEQMLPAPTSANGTIHLPPLYGVAGVFSGLRNVRARFAQCYMRGSPSYAPMNKDARKKFAAQGMLPRGILFELTFAQWWLDSRPLGRAR
jgi:hypothetical protein